MSSFFLNPLSHVQVTKINKKLVTKIVKTDNCHTWTGETTSDGYGVIRLSVATNVRKRVKVHRLIYFIAHSQPLPPHLHVSHLCHNKICCNLKHLSLEPAGINNQRNTCRTDKHCFGHNTFKNCIFGK